MGYNRERKDGKNGMSQNKHNTNRGFVRVFQRWLLLFISPSNHPKWGKVACFPWNIIRQEYGGIELGCFFPITLY